MHNKATQAQEDKEIEQNMSALDEANKGLKPLIQGRETSFRIELPKAASFILYCSRLIAAPVFVVPVLMITLALYVLLQQSSL